MTKIKYNLEYELVENKYRKLDPIGKFTFNQAVVAEKEGNIHIVDLKKSSNFVINITDEDSWIKFVNYSGVHRFDLLIEVTGNITTNSIKFGNGEQEYIYPQYTLLVGQLEEFGITPYIMWPYKFPLKEEGLKKGSKAIVTVRFGPIWIDLSLVDAFVAVSYQWYE